MTVIKVFYFIPNSRKSNSNSDRNFRCMISVYCERNNLVHFWCTVFGETACISYSIICDILFDGAATSGIGLQCSALSNAEWLHWLTRYIFTRESSYCLNRVLAIAILSVRLSVRPSHGWNEIRPRLLLITNRKSYTGFRLPPISMTLNIKIGFLMDFLAILGCDRGLYHSQGEATLLSLCDPDKEFGICILT